MNSCNFSLTYRLGLSIVFKQLRRVNMDVSRGLADGSLLHEYSPPEWAKTLSFSPKYKVQLAMLNTPIQKWNLPGLPDDFEVFIKRDDMTGSSLSGNKVRKLEFIFADAIQKGCKHFITCGGIGSNYCRAAALSARQLGLTPHLVLRAGIEEVENVELDGNVFLDVLAGAKLYLTPAVAPYQTQLLPRMQQIQKRIKDQTGESAYLSPVGGSDAVGFYGYLEAFRELMSQGLHERFDDIVFSTGSGGTCEGLAAGNYLTGSKVKVHGVAVCDDTKYFHDHAGVTFKDVGLDGIRPEDALDIIEGYKGEGYGIASDEDFDFICETAKKTGIILDPTYTAKGVRGLVQEIQTNPDRFKGRRILFIHTGGIYGVYDGRLTPVLKEAMSSVSKVEIWNDLACPPF